MSCPDCGHARDNHSPFACQSCTTCGELIATHPNPGQEGWHDIKFCDCGTSYAEIED